MSHLSRLILSILAALLMSFTVHPGVDESAKPAQDSNRKSGAAPKLASVAGDFYHGDGLGMRCSLVVEREGRFSFVWRGCVGISSLNRGGARIMNDHLILAPELPNEPESFGGLPTDFIPVRWGERLYLISKDDGKRFCEAVNQGGEPRSSAIGRFYLRRSDRTKKVTGLPDVPAAWQSWLQKKQAEDPK